MALMLAGCARDPTPSDWSASGGALAAPTLGEVVRYRASVDEAAACAQRRLEEAGYTLAGSDGRLLTFRRRAGLRVISVRIRLVPSERGLLRQWRATLSVIDGPPLSADEGSRLLRGIAEVLEPLGPVTTPYIRDLRGWSTPYIPRSSRLEHVVPIAGTAP